MSSGLASMAAQSLVSTSKIDEKMIIESHLNSPKALDISFAHETNFPTTGNGDEGIDAIKNASLYDLIKI